MRTLPSAICITAICFLAICLAILDLSHELEASDPPRPSTATANADWLLNPAPYRSQIQTVPPVDPLQTEAHPPTEIRLSNGLAERVWQISPQVATTSLKLLSTGEEYVRAVGPEARLTIDGQSYPIGGLTGQPVKNYLKREWLSQLKPLPASYTFVAYQTGPIEERFPWKKRPEWMPRDLPWPPPGQHLTLQFAPPAIPPQFETGKVLFQERFGENSPASKIDAGWKPTVSTKHPRTSYYNEGKAGELMALPDTCVYLERAWPTEAASVELTIDCGDDSQANSWGPGLAWKFPEGTISLVARPHSQQFEFYGLQGGEQLLGQFDRTQAITLRLSLQQNEVVCEAAQKGAAFQSLARIPVSSHPQTLRIGKIGKHGDGKDYPTARGEPYRSHLHEVILRAKPTSLAKPALADLPQVEMHYEIYDGLPLFSKWMVVNNTTSRPVVIDQFVSEELRLVEVESSVEDATLTERYNLHVESEYAFHAMDAAHACEAGVRIQTDPDYPTQVNYRKQTRCLLEASPLLGPGIHLPPGQRFTTYRVYELLLDSTDRERRGLAQRRMYRTLAPWVTENPLMFHKVQSDPISIREAIAQCADTGFEMIIMSFGSGVNLENSNAAYRQKYRQLADEARQKGIALGGYTLTGSRSAGTPADNTQGAPAAFGVMPCLGSAWGRDYLQRVKDFLFDAGLSVLENDGPYPGDLCHATSHPHHHGLADSQWVQWEAQSDLYRWCRKQGIYVNQPDWYFLNGGNKTGMGYRETNWSLPRAEQEIIERQNIYDGTWTKTQSMGWMFVPLSQYHGGGAAATIEPLAEHLDHYEARLANLIGSGTQACYRGPRLYDTQATREVVCKWTNFFKDHREVLGGDLIHLRRANGRDWDGWMTVNPAGRERGLAFFYNPLETEVRQIIQLPVYYTGLTAKARVTMEQGSPQVMPISTEHQLAFELAIPPRSRTWVLLEEDVE